METVTPVTLKEELKFIIDHKTKPLGALGRLEEIACQVGMIQRSTKPSIQTPHIVVFAADHGIAATGLVNPYPQEVTAQMVLNFLAGGAAINIFCRQHHISLKIIDAGVKYDFDSIDHPGFINAKIGNGTADYRKANAMSEEQAALAIEKGRQIVSQIVLANCNCIGFGEMGIGNTSAASLIMSAVIGLPVEECAGRGTGADEAHLHTKIKTLREVFAFHQLQHYRDSPIQLLSRVGGFEIAMMVGGYLQAANENMVIVVDGFIATAALLIARQLNPHILFNCIFAHKSGENGHALMLDYLGVKSLLDLGMRLGEGTGAALAIPLIQSAVNFLNEMASFENAGVSTNRK